MWRANTQRFLPVFTDDTTPSFVLLPEDQKEIIIKFMFVKFPIVREKCIS